MSAAQLSPDLIAGFETAACAAAATVERIARSSEAIAQAVARLLPAGARIAIAQPCDLPESLFAACRRLPGVIEGRSKQELAACDAGITDAFAAIARTGSICVCVDSADAGMVSLLPRLHIAVLPGDSIVQRPRELFDPSCLGGKGVSRNFVFITGPSATADMGPLVRGVHGPHRLHILVLK